jgi:two-component system sensor histidine kinase DegS
MGTRAIVTSAETQHTLRELIDLLGEAESVTRDFLGRIVALVDRAQAISDQTSEVRAELEQFLEQFALESGMPSNSAPDATFFGGSIDLEVMRADVANVALNASRAAIVASSLRSFRNSLEQAARYFADDSALTVSLDATAEQFQTAVNEAREDERRRLAREIHDGPAQVLSNAIYAIQTAEQYAKRAPEDVADQLVQVREYLRQGMTEVRRFMFDLQPATLQDLGLAITVQRYVEGYARFFGRRAACTINGILPSLSDEQNLTIFRIIQESLQNAHKHAGTDAGVDVTISADEDTVTARISDDGVGFDPALVAPKLESGAGILGMRDRASIARARLSVESTVGSGSVITLVLPIDSQSDLGQVRSL